MGRTCQGVIQVVLILTAMMTSGVWLEENLLAYPVDNIYAEQNLFVIAHWFDSRVVRHVHTDEKLVALTFDDGPDPRYTPEILNILRQYHVRATFFVVGESAEKHPELVRREIREGHEVENHSYTHPDLTRQSTRDVLQEIKKAEKAIKAVTGRKPQYFRPPRGLFNAQVVEVSQKLGMKIVLWDIGVEHQVFEDHRDMAYRVVARAHPGIIILAHDGRLDRRLTVRALPMVIQEYQRMGYRFVTLSELLAAAE